MEDSRGGYGGKRSRSQYEQGSGERNGRQKRQGQGGPPDFFSEPRITVDEIIYRILCPTSKIGSVIGKGGNIIKSLRHETGAKIKIEDAVPGADERVIIIATSGRDRDRLGREGKPYGEKERDEKDKDSLNAKDGSRDKILPSVQEALFKVHCRVVDGEGSASEEEDDGSRTITTRLLVPNSQIGCLLGRGGKIIEQMRSETGAQIRILSKDQLPRCALLTDELVQLSGDMGVVKKALHAISSRLYEHPPKDRHQGLPMPLMASGGGLMPHGAFYHPGNPLMAPGGMGGSFMLPPVSHMGAEAWPFGSGGGPFLSSTPGGQGVPRDAPEEELVIRILCPNDKVGSIIGKKGNLIRQLREQTHAQIKISDPVPNADERVIIVSANEILGDPSFPCLDAALQLQRRITELSQDKDDETTTRLLVPSANIGCLLGRGGGVITEMRKLTKANIRVLPKDSLPACALETDELVQVSGQLGVAQDALIQIVSRLRANLFKGYGDGGGKGGNMNSASAYGGAPMSSEYEDRHKPGSPGAAYNLPPLGLQRSSMHSSSGWGLQDGAGTLSGSSALGSGRSNSGFMANVSVTTLDIAIPSSIIGSIIGKGGCNIAQIRQISGAKVRLRAPDFKSGDQRMVEISGTPEQTQAAQSLLEAFIITAQSQQSKY